jgi:hypothetical protein
MAAEWVRRMIAFVMLSPPAHHKRLERVEPELGLTAFRCSETGGHAGHGGDHLH